MDIINYKNPLDTAIALSDKVADTLKKAIAKKGMATLVVSGGSTPAPMFKHLSKQKLDWSKVTVTLADERCVDPEDPQSNALLVQKELLINEAAKAKFVALFDGGKPSLEHQKIAHSRVASLPRYDAVILGMGGDGHTASIFPEADNRDIALEVKSESSHSSFALLTDPKTVTPLRITQTAKRLLDTDNLIIHISGDEKSALLEQICTVPDEKKWPISAFIEQKIVPLSLYQSTSGYQNTAGALK